MNVLLGAPNVVRGGSHSGNVAAAGLAAEGLLEYPASLSRAVRIINQAPAQAAGLSDRGEIAIGLRADLVQARRRKGLPVVQQVWRQAKRVF